MTNFGPLLLRTIILLLLISVFAVVTIRFAVAQIKRFSKINTSTQSHMAVLERLSVGHQQNILAIQVGKKILILSQTTSGLKILTEIHEDLWIERSGELKQNKTTFDDLLSSPSIQDRATSYSGEDLIL